MKRNIITILLSTLSIVVFIALQAYLVVTIYNQEVEKFDYRYRELVDKAIEWMITNRRDNGFAKANFILDGLSKKMEEYLTINASVDTMEFRELVYRQFYDIIFRFSEVDTFLASYLHSINIKDSFVSDFEIKRINLIGLQKLVPIYNESIKLSGKGIQHRALGSNALVAYQYHFEGNFFNMEVNYSVDFSNKKREVFKRAALSIGIAFLSLIIIVGGLLFTLGNLLKEKKLSQMKTDFINNMTHELKTPLSTISVASRTLECEQVASDPIRVLETARVIARQNTQLSRQINHLLEISKWERKQFELYRRWLNPAAFVKGVIELCRWECKAAEVSITEEYSTSEAMVFIDETMITAALVNLFSNAVKYNTRKPEVHFRVWTDSMLNISITDNGIGIARDEQVHIFDKFYRVNTGNLHNVKGLGLGLYYVKHIVEAHGGQVTVSSKPGQGSTFTVKLPIDGKG